MNRALWRGRRVFVTGHTGFKGRWLARLLAAVGADVTGYSLDTGQDVRDLEALRGAMCEARPDVVLHLAAQSLVHASYVDPVRTFTTNVIGTVHLLESLRAVPSARVAIVVTSDKCYANDGGDHAFTEDDVLGGDDPYSASKAGAEHAIAAYRRAYASELPRVVAVRAGNVLGGGDRSADRVVPDLVRAFEAGTPAAIRHPSATRPWQFVLDALHGYLLAAETASEREVAASYNFGPVPSPEHTVAWIAETMAARWGDGASWVDVGSADVHEAPALALDASRARRELGWRPLLDVEETIRWTTDWYKSERDLTDEQIARFLELATA